MTPKQQDKELTAKVLTNKIAEVKVLKDDNFRLKNQIRVLEEDKTKLGFINVKLKEINATKTELINKMKKDGYTNGR